MLHNIYNIFMTFIGGVKLNADTLVLELVLQNGYQGMFARMATMILISMFWLLAWKLPIMIVGSFTKTTDTTLLTWTTHIDKVLMIVSLVFICAPMLPLVSMAIGG